ncbi:RagB/SusD family nutrient uptake outer membrane protein [Polaribacter reichenbachii]|uniref:Starch-binding protein n=1 Tax=Polaribacter reichenbachii TaxID=996801 RepID=A0A1B8TNS0_9FLAO|nr:RagB/SusD family nutrient uptake outer membrane protein [Polaribacter reichenbachii]APZ46664.1 RagB/SusD family nutrient uptake outer membrane protein [Polaribacter reichenbachii]AUC17307.1 RagB/SusD family nutrient uptake outer membrane protein [Polaribacter reichenbachii]OBY61245.1 starch-binding protein [Polaribacter reichenbachii]
MRKIKIKIISIAILSATLLLGSCTEEILQEEPRGVFTPDFFQTELGVQGGLTYLYENLRYLYGQPYYYNSLETGTDEYTYAQSADNNFKNADLSGVGNIISDTYTTSVAWNTVFPAINTASGIIENAAAVGIDASVVAEAKFFRAFNYFLLVQQYGGVPLDLGSGELVFNSSAVRTSIRNTVPEVYTKGIFPDLVAAINELPDSPRLTGTATKNVARLHLAKAYLTYAWWLENPNGIPTYPETPRTDPDGKDALYYFQQAYTIAMDGINNPGPYSLQEYFYDVHVGSNDRHSEMMLYADRTEESPIYNGASLGWSGTGGSANTAVWMVTSNYTTIKVDDVAAVQREADQSLGRPWTRMAPSINVFEETFAEKDLDSRYDGTFVSSYRGNWDKGGNSTPSLTAANGMQITPGDAVISFLDDYDATVDYSVNGGNLGGGEVAGRSDYVINLNEINRRFYPGLWKLGTYRTDNEGGLGQPNGAITRPFPIAKFSEFYFIAAEAYVKGATGGQTAYQLINVIRGRAGKWRYDNGEKSERMEDNSAAMIAATPLVVDLDFILAERSREYFGEGYRWLDLVRTQKWAEYAASYKIASNDASDHSPTTTNRTIEKFHYLRPIPQSQIDDLDMSDDEKSAYQNPGY